MDNQVARRGRQKVLRNKEIPVPTDAHHPEPPYNVLPKHEFTMGLIAPKGSGKTTAIINLMDFFIGHFHAIVVFSPTVHSDDKWQYVRKKPYLAENVELNEFIKEIQSQEDDPTVVVRPAPQAPFGEYPEDDEEFDPKIPEECFLDDYDEATLLQLMDEQDKVVKWLEDHGKTKHLANRVLLIFDDLVGSHLFSSKRSSPFKRLNVRHRHYSMSILMVTQAYKEIPKTVRTQFSALIMFAIANAKELLVIYEENPCGLPRNLWEQLFAHATSGEYNFLYINYQKPKPLRLMKNYEQVLLYNPEMYSSGSLL